MCGHGGHRLQTGGRFSDDMEARLLAEQLPKPEQEEPVIIGDHQPEVISPGRRFFELLGWRTQTSVGRVETHRRPRAGCGPYGHLAAERAHALTNAEQPETMLGARRPGEPIRIETCPVVGDLEDEHGAVPPQQEVRRADLRVLDDIGQKLLHALVDGDAQGFRQVLRPIEAQIELDPQLVSLEVPLRQPFQGRREPQVVENRRAEVEGQGARLPNRALQERQDLLQVSLETVEDRIAPELGDAQLDERELLDDVVVQRDRDFAAFPSLGQGQFGRQPPEPVLVILDPQPSLAVLLDLEVKSFVAAAQSLCAFGQKRLQRLDPFPEVLHVSFVPRVRWFLRFPGLHRQNLDRPERSNPRTMGAA